MMQNVQLCTSRVHQRTVRYCSGCSDCSTDFKNSGVRCSDCSIDFKNSGVRCSDCSADFKNLGVRCSDCSPNINILTVQCSDCSEKIRCSDCSPSSVRTVRRAVIIPVCAAPQIKIKHSCANIIWLNNFPFAPGKKHIKAARTGVIRKVSDHCWKYPIFELKVYDHFAKSIRSSGWKYTIRESIWS